MKTACALALVSSTVLSWTPSQAAECTQSQLAVFDNVASDATFAKVCESVIAASSVTSVDLNSIATLNPCGDQDCLAYFKTLQKKAPNCEVSGFSLPATFDLLFSVCDLLPSNDPLGPTGTSKPTTTTTPRTTAPSTADPTEDEPINLPSLNETTSDSDTPLPTTTPSPRATTIPPLAIVASKPPATSDAAAATCSLAMTVVAAAFAVVVQY